MTHLRIEQNNNVEVVDAYLIQKLYEIASSEDIQSIQLSGNLQCGYCYQTPYQYLTGNIEGTNQKRFPDLNIVAQGLYFAFQDAEVERILAQNFGDGNGILQSRVETLSSFSGKFANNKNIEYFNELSSFSNITEINSNNRFNSCTNLKQIDLSNITKISGANGYERWNFESCSNLESVGDTSKCTYFGHGAFNKCGKLTEIDLSAAVYVGESAFQNCTSMHVSGSMANIQTIGEFAFLKCQGLPTTISLPALQGTLRARSFGNTNVVNVTNLGSITQYGDQSGSAGGYWDPFSECSQLKTIVIPATCTSFKDCANSPRNLRWVKVLATSVPTCQYNNMFGYSYNSNNDTYTGATYPIYVVDDIYNDYINDSIWSQFYRANRLKKLSQFSTDFPNE